jgi:hypothetical protein
VVLIRPKGVEMLEELKAKFDLLAARAAELRRFL